MTYSDWLGCLSQLLARKGGLTVIGIDQSGSSLGAGCGVHYPCVPQRKEMDKVWLLLGNRQKGMDAGSTQWGLVQVFGAN